VICRFSEGLEAISSRVAMICLGEMRKGRGEGETEAARREGEEGTLQLFPKR